MPPFVHAFGHGEDKDHGFCFFFFFDTFSQAPKRDWLCFRFISYWIEDADDRVAKDRHTSSVISERKVKYKKKNGLKQPCQQRHWQRHRQRQQCAVDNTPIVLCFAFLWCCFVWHAHFPAIILSLCHSLTRPLTIARVTITISLLIVINKSSRFFLLLKEKKRYGPWMSCLGVSATSFLSIIHS